MAKKSAVAMVGALEKVRGKLAALPTSEVALPPIPVERLVAEALALAVTAQRARDELVAAGLDADALVELPLQAHALAEAQAELVALRGVKRSESEVALEATATELR